MKSFNPILDNTYSAKAGTQVEDILDNSRSKDIINFIYAFHAFVLLLIILVAFMVLYIGNYNMQWLNKLEKITEQKLEWQQNEALLLSIAMTSTFFTIYIIILDSLAVNSYINRMNVSTFNGILIHIPPVVLVFDLLFAIFSAIFIVFFLCSCINCFSCKNCKIHYVFAVLIVLCQIVIFVTHLPFIIVAYLNDAYHAGSIFIYYLISCLLLLSIIEVGYYTFKRLVPVEVNQGIQIKCEKSSLRIIESKETDGFEEVDSAATLKFNKAEIIDMKAKLTLLDGKVVNGKLTDLRIELDSPERAVFDMFLTLKNEENLLLQCTLVLKDKKEIEVKGECCIKECNFEQPNEISIGECQLYNESGIFVCKNECVSKATCCQIAFVVICIISLFILTLAGIVLTATYLVLIPINRSISDAPNRLIGVYNTVFLIFGVYIAYKTFLKRKLASTQSLQIVKKH